MKTLGEELQYTSPRKKYLVGVSGGKDSMALLHGLHRLGFRRLVVCHLDHQLRGGVSAADSVFVAKQAAQLEYPFLGGGQDVSALASAKKLSIETAAREARMGFFSNCARLERCPRVFLAHHKQDQLETVLQNFFRGSGRRGLGGMAPVAKISSHGKLLEFFRPLLSVSREEICSWVAAEKIPWREDATNLSPAHTRNRIRHRLLPILEEILGRDFRPSVLRTAEILREEDTYLENLAGAVPADSPLEVSLVRSLDLVLQRRIVLAWLRQQGIEDVGFFEVEEILRMLDVKNGPAKINLPGNRHARRTSGLIYLESHL